MKILTLNQVEKLVVFVFLVAVVSVFGQTDKPLSKSAKPKLIRGDVFIIDKNALSLPKDFSKLHQITTIYVSEINVSDIAWNNGFPNLPEIFEFFAIEYTVTIGIKEDANFKFKLVSDDGSKLYIDKKVVVDNDGVHSFLPVGGSAKLTKGDHAFKLQFFQGPRYQAGIQLFVKKDGSNESIFPGNDIELIAEDAPQKP